MKIKIVNTKSTAEELYRIHSYSKLLATLCQDSEQAINTMQLEQIFADIATVTEKAYVNMNELIAQQKKDYIDPDDQSVTNEPPF